MLHFMQKQRGAISVFLVCILLPMVVLEGLLIDFSKLMGAKTAISGAGELAQNGALASYDQVLYEVYGLFATSKDEEELEKNVMAYFQETLQDAGIQATDEQVRSLLAMSLDTTTFEVTPISNTSLADTRILKNQILEYIKLRGPAYFGLSLFEKIKAISSVNKESNAVKKELEFEEKLEKIEDKSKAVFEACKNVLNNCDTISYDSINVIENSVPVMEGELEALGKIQKKLQEMEAAAGTVTVSKYDLCVVYKVLSEEENDDLNQFIENNSTSIHITKEDVEKIQNIKTYVSAIDNNKNNGDILQASDALLIYMEQYKSNHAWKKAEQLKAQYDSYKGNKVAYKAIEEKCPDLKIKLEEIFGGNYDQTYNLIKQIDKVEAPLKQGVTNVWEYMHMTFQTYYDAAKELKTMSQTLMEKIGDLKSEIENVKQAGEDWHHAIEVLSDGSSKESMMSKYESEAKALEIEDIDELQTKAENIKNYYEVLETDLAQIKYDTYILKDTSCSDSIIQALISKLDAEGNMPDGMYQEGTLKSDIQSCQVKNQIESSKFYQYLKKACGSEDGETKDTGKKEEAENAKAQIMNEGSKAVAKADASKLKNVEDSVFFSLPSKNSSLLDAPENAPENATENTTDNSKIKDNATKTMDSATTFLGNLENLLTKAKEDLLISMYGSDMFSYYTVDTKPMKDKGGNYTIAGNTDEYHLLSEEYNYMYRSEIEYLIWGNQDAQTNVNNTFLSIFGIRFLLNTIYAFTGDIEITSTTYQWAVAIAGWTGFGVPIVQSVLTLALSLAESVYDVAQLAKGEDVVVFKSKQTWVMKPSGFTSEVIKNTSEYLADTATKKISELMDKAETITLSKIDEFQSELDTTLDDSVDMLIDNSVGKLIAPLQAKTLELVRTGQNNINTIHGEVEGVISELEASVSNPETAAQKVEQKVFAYVKENYLDEFSKKIQNMVNYADDKVEEFFDSNDNSLRTNIKAMLDTNELFSDVKEQVSQARKKLEEGAQEAAQELISKGMGKLSDAVSGSKSIITDGVSQTGVSKGMMLTMNYKEYADVFLMLSTLTNEEAVLLRIADLIQLNMGMRQDGFSMKGTITMVSLNAKVNVGTNFIGRIDSALGTNTGGKMSYPLTYHGVLGY